MLFCTMVVKGLKHVEKKEFNRLVLPLSLATSASLWNKVGIETAELLRYLTVFQNFFWSLGSRLANNFSLALRSL